MTLLFSLLALAGISGGITYYIVRSGEKRKAAAIKRSEDLKIAHEKMLTSPHPPWTPQFDTPGDGSGDAQAYANLAAWKGYRAQRDRAAVSRPYVSPATLRSSTGDDMNMVLSASMFNSFDPKINDDHPRNIMQEEFKGKGGTFDGGGAGGDWTPSEPDRSYDSSPSDSSSSSSDSSSSSSSSD